MMFTFALPEILLTVLTSLPASPFPAAVVSRSPFRGGGGGADRISRLPNAVLSNIVSRLPAKDAARTAVLSRRWRRVWASTPLVLDDTDLADLPASVRAAPAAVPVDWIAVNNAVGRILDGHPGPFRFVCITCCCLARVRGSALARWFRCLAAAGVEHLILINRPFPVDLRLPAGIFRIASLRTLYLGFWEFPDTPNLPRGPSVFPHLREIGLCHVRIDTSDFDHLLECSPVLEKLAFIATYFNPLHVRIRNRSLRSLIFWRSVAKELDVVVAPCLERLILWQTISCSPAYIETRVRIGYATKLKVLGYLDPNVHQLMIGSTIIESGSNMSPSTMVPSVTILALKIRFGVRKEAKMLPTFLRCFPNIETLHIMSHEADEPTGKLNFKFWQESDPINSLETHITKVVFNKFRGERSELAFLKFILERAQSLLKLVVVLANADPASADEMFAKLKPLTTANRASDCPKLMIIAREGDSTWCFQTASDLCVSDPFDG